MWLQSLRQRGFENLRITQCRFLEAVLKQTEDVKSGLQGSFARGFFPASRMREVARYVYSEDENFPFMDAVHHCVALRVTFLHIHREHAPTIKTFFYIRRLNTALLQR